MNPGDPTNNSGKVPTSASAHRTFSLTPSPKRPFREQIASAFLTVGTIMPFVGAMMLCDCQFFYIITALSGVVAFFLGSKRQKVGGFILVIIGSCLARYA